MERLIDAARTWWQMGTEGARSGDFDSQEGLILSKCMDLAQQTGQTPDHVLDQVQVASGIDLSGMAWGFADFAELARSLRWVAEEA